MQYNSIFFISEKSVILHIKHVIVPCSIGVSVKWCSTIMQWEFGISAFQEFCPSVSFWLVFSAWLPDGDGWNDGIILVLLSWRRM